MCYGSSFFMEDNFMLEILKAILPETPDDWRKFLCDHYINCSYYDNENFNEGLQNILDKISKSSYA